MRFTTIMLLATTAILASCGGGEATPPVASGGGGAAPPPSPAPSPTPTPSPTPSPTPTPPPSSGGGLDARQEEMLTRMLATHNAARAEVEVGELELDEDLNRAALAYAEELARTGMFQHSPSGDRPRQGENLWAGTASLSLTTRWRTPGFRKNDISAMTHFPTSAPQETGRMSGITPRSSGATRRASAAVLRRAWDVIGSSAVTLRQEMSSASAPFSDQSPNCSDTSFAKASARWLMACFSSGAISAKV